MLAHVITAYLHFLGMMMLMATLLAEHVILHTQMPPLHLHRSSGFLMVAEGKRESEMDS
jgi:uncharacterized membrane protein